LPVSAIADDLSVGWTTSLPAQWTRVAPTVQNPVSGEVAANSQKSQSPPSEQQIDDEYDQQNTADTDATAISPPAIAETAPEKEDQYYNNQDQIHLLLRCGFP
jgi:hypothetical protein